MIFNNDTEVLNSFSQSRNTSEYLSHKRQKITEIPPKTFEYVSSPEDSLARLRQLREQGYQNALKKIEMSKQK